MLTEHADSPSFPPPTMDPVSLNKYLRLSAADAAEKKKQRPDEQRAKWTHLSDAAHGPRGGAASDNTERDQRKCDGEIRETEEET